MEHPLFEIVTTTAGAISIRNKAVNEIMHNPVGPWKEANALYVEQSRLKELLSQDLDQELVIFDVGLGAAANALAALACINAQGENCRPVRIVSFERDLELLRFALQHANQFDHFRGYEQSLEQLLNKGFCSHGKVSWQLRHGHFLDLIEQETFRPQLIFFDPYSPKVNREMWSTACFSKLKKLCRSFDEGGTILFTYSQSTPIRVSMILAGFFIGSGEATGFKNETTQAATDLRLLSSPLQHVWFERWKRSQDPFPFEAKAEDRESISAQVRQYMKENFGIL